MQRTKLFGALFAYVSNIQITWKTIHLSVFCRTNIPSTAQIRAEGNNTKCVEKKRFNGSVTHGLRKEHVFSPPFLDKVRSSFYFLIVICNSLLLLKSLPINVINCIKFYVNLNRRLWLAIKIFVCLFIFKSSPMIHRGNRSFLEVTWQMFEKKLKWKSNGGIIGSKAKSCCNGV